MNFLLDLRPGFDYGRASHQIELAEGGAVFRSGNTHLTVHRIGRPGQSVRDLGIQIDEAGQGAWWTYRVRAGHIGGMVLESPTAWSTATTPRPRPTGWPGTKARSRCARSGTSTPWLAPGGSRTPA
jgi:hypothetical protein